jgi:hypothetical protein
MTFHGVKRAFQLAAIVTAVIFSSPYLVAGQKVVDKTVATVSDGSRTELITYSDLKWQLALNPDVPIDPPSSEDLNRMLRLLIDQRLFALEAERLPHEAPTKGEIKAAINDVIKKFTVPGELERRLKIVGIKSVSEPAFEQIMAERIAIDKYLTFRFRSFVVITAADELKYYNEVYVPEFRRRNRGVIVPTLESRRAQIVEALTEQRVAEQIETFLDEAKRRAEIVILNPV